MERDKLLLLGGGRTGIALHRYCEAHCVSHEWIADTRLVRTPTDFLRQFYEAVASPGIDPKDPVVAECLRLGVTVRSELDYAAQRLPCPIAAATGTNGKTTVTRLLYEMLTASGYDAYLAGNGGVPLTAILGQTCGKSVAVVEASSFMLETSPNFRARACGITNLTPDHLDRHGSMEAYARAKANVYANSGRGDTVVLNADDPNLPLLPKPPVPPLYFSLGKPCDAHLDGRKLRLFGRELLERDDLKIKGDHNVANVLCAALIASGMGADPSAIAAAAAAFAGTAHRIEYIGGDDRGVRYYNDSKATNVESVLVALSSFPSEPLTLIAGGSSKGVEFDELIRGLPDNCIGVIATGATADRIARAARRCGDNRVRVVPAFDDAVREAARTAEKNGIVLLSPACASFDVFRDYRERGDRFCALAKELGAKR